MKLKKIMLVILAATMAFTGSGVLVSAGLAAEGYIAMYVQNPAAYIDGGKTPIDQTNPKVAPYLKNGLAYVPLRFTAEALGGQIEWDAKKMAATVKTKNGNTFEITEVYKPELVGGRTYIPAEAIAKIFGKQYFYERGLIVIADKNSMPETSGLISAFTGMETVGTKEKFLEYCYDVYSEPAMDWEIAVPEEPAPAPGPVPAPESPAASAPDSGVGSADKPAPDASADYSETNTQVAGVDEADIIKTDGQYIYYVRGGAIEIVKANADGSFEYMSAFKMPYGNYLEFKEIFIDGGRITAIGGYYGRDSYYTQAIVINAEDKKAPKLERVVDVKGEYVTSRKIGSSVYFAATQHLYRWNYDWESEVMPALYRDTAVSEKAISPGYDRLYCFPDFTESAITTLVGFNIDRPNEEAFIESIVGLGGENIYMSSGALYIAALKYNSDRNSSWYDTVIHKFAADDGELVFVGSGTAPGSVLNQFSMDEHKGHLRIATTKQDYGKGWTKYNCLYIFDGSMKIVGKIEDIAPGEQIYSARFMGERGYMVTFKQVDPLFAIDLSDPANPVVMGALKIPGYSNYLHPYDENHLIGFGKDTVLDAYGNAFYTSMKISLFDVSDITNPIELFVETIGDRGTESVLLQNHKALLFSKEKNLLAFPVTVFESKEKAVDGKAPSYGTFKFAGAYIYEIDLKKGFNLRGKISHLSSNDMLKSSEWGSDGGAYIERLLTIKNTLYAASNRKLSSHNLDTLNTIGEFYFK